MARWVTVAPILENYNNLALDSMATKPVAINDICINGVYKWIKDDDILKYLSYNNKKEVKDARCMFVAEYEASSLGDPDLSCKSEKPRGKQRIALEKIQICNMALWLSQPSPLGFNLVFHINADDKILRQSFITSPIRNHMRDAKKYHSKDDFKKAKQIYEIILSIKRDNSLWLANKTLFEALTSSAWETRFLLLWVVLESLFGTSTEVAYRISHRIGFFLSADRKEAENICSKVKLAYSWRSKIVHGLRHKLNQKESEEVLYNTECFARSALLKILEDPHLSKIFSSSEDGREKYLDSLLFLK